MTSSDHIGFVLLQAKDQQVSSSHERALAMLVVILLL